MCTKRRNDRYFIGSTVDGTNPRAVGSVTSQLVSPTPPRKLTAQETG